jgi:hypothetical protein
MKKPSPRMLPATAALPLALVNSGVLTGRRRFASRLGSTAESVVSQSGVSQSHSGSAEDDGEEGEFEDGSGSESGSESGSGSGSYTGSESGSGESYEDGESGSDQEDGDHSMAEHSRVHDFAAEVDRPREPPVPSVSASQNPTQAHLQKIMRDSLAARGRNRCGEGQRRCSQRGRGREPGRRSRQQS